LLPDVREKIYIYIYNFTKGGGNDSKYDLAYKKPFSVQEYYIKTPKRFGRKLCALSLLCVFVLQWKYQASGLLAASNHL
jgi:hypothetical protein